MTSIYPREVLSSEEREEKARDELNETPELRGLSLRLLREKMADAKGKARAKNPKLTEDYMSRDSDSFLLRFLRVRKFNVDDALAHITRYEQFRADHPDLFQATLSDFRDIVSMGMTGVLPVRHPSGAIIMPIYAGRLDPDCDKRKMLMCSVYCCEKLLESEETQISGGIMIEDLTGMNLLKAMKAGGGPETKLSMHWLQECVPLRMKGLQIVNPPWYIRAMMAIVWPLLKKKMRERIFVYPDEHWKQLHERIPPSVLPREFGGTIDFDGVSWIDEIAR